MAVPDVLPSFPPVRWAAAYGSAALRQSGYKPGGGSMVDYVFVVDDPYEWHSQNLARNPRHYAGLMRLCGAGVVSFVQVGGRFFSVALIRAAS